MLDNGTSLGVCPRNGLDRRGCGWEMGNPPCGCGGLRKTEIREVAGLILSRT